MKNQIKKTIALFLVFVQLIALFPLGMTTAQAAQSDPETPELNQTIVGTVAFQSFNFLGDNVNGVDGTDYTTTFYYSDDYFAPSAINDAADKRVMLWSDLDNKPLATCSMDFAVAAMTSAKDDVLRATSETWNNSKYDRWISEADYEGFVKERNVREFLSACGFSGIECTELYKRPTNDSIGFTLASKEIKVWNADTRKNETYTLIAVGVRGAGYGQEWASNISIGDPATGAIPQNGRHWGFDDSAKKVCGAISTYLREHSITGNVKYWVTGFSRAAAVANLTAGYLTDDASAYQTRQKDVYAYTWECPQAAKKTASPDTNFQNYKNIHNILNPMDAVPKVSPDEFEHQRLGVDYQMPYHGHAEQGLITNDQHTALYTRMFEVLKTIATGCAYTGKVDPLIETVDPNNYPYNRPIKIYRVDGAELIEQAIGYALSTNKENAKLLKEFGTVEAEQQHTVSGWLSDRTEGNVKDLRGWDGKNDYKTSTWYLDDFIDSLVDIFLTSNAWVGGIGTGRTAMENRATFISEYQPDFRTLFGYFLDYAGPAFLDLVPNLVDAVTGSLGTSLFSGFPYYFLRFYRDPTNASKRQALIESAQGLAPTIINRLTSGFPDPDYQLIYKQDAIGAMQQLIPLVINLYAYELNSYDSQYLGTTLRYLNTILCTHEQETVLSWIMSIDSNHMNRSCRTLTLPQGCDAVIYEFRLEYPQYDGNPTDGVTTAPKVAELTGGVLDSKDDRITLYQENGRNVIRYPASLQLRVDLKPRQTMNLNQIFVDDYQTLNEYVAVSADKTQFQNKPLASTYQSVTQLSSKTNAAATNNNLSAYGTISAGDTLHVLVDDIDAYNASNTSTYTLSVEKAPKSVVAQYSMETVLAENVRASALPADADGFAVNGSGQLVWTGNVTSESKQYENFFADNYNFTEYQLTDLGEASVTTNDSAKTIPTKQTFTVVPATNIYYDDGLLSQQVSTVNAEPNYQAKVEAAEPNELVAASGNQVSFRFTGTRVDVYLNTNDQSGVVGAYLLNANGTERYTKNGQVYSKLVNGKSENELSNIPVISYSGMDYGTYTLVIVTPSSKTTRIDGVRVYDERVTQYLSLRETLIDPDNWVSDSTVSGAVYLDGGSTTTDIAAYKKDGPKGEVYLSSGNGIAFQIEDFSSSASYRIGLSAVSGSPVRVQLNSEDPFWISTATHMFYDLHPTDSGEVVIRNLQGGILSVTDIEMTPVIRTSAPKSIKLSVSPQLMRFAASLSAPAEPEETAEPSPEVTEEPTPDVTPEPTSEATPEPTSGISDIIQQLISSFVSSLFGSISRLFGN